MNTQPSSPESVHRIPGGECVEDIDGGRLRIRMDDGSEFLIPIVRGQRVVEEAAAKAAAEDDATFWTQLAAVMRALADLCGTVMDEDLTDSIKHRLAIAFSKKKAAQSADFAALRNSVPSTDSGSED